MITLYVLSIGSFFGIFVLFLVLSKTLNAIGNNLVKLEYLLQKELDFKKEQIAIKKLMEEEKAEKAESDAANAETQQPPAANDRTQKK